MIERCILRHTLAFGLDWLAAMFDGVREIDQLDILIALSTWNANTHHLDNDLRSRNRACFGPGVLPMEDRRGTSRSALARFLNLPVETVRRRVDILIAKRVMLERTDGLISLVAGGMSDARGVAIVRANTGAFARFYESLLADGLDLAPAEWLEQLPGGDVQTRPEWTRAVMRSSAEFVLLATSEALTAFGLGFSTLRVFLTVLRRNIADIDEPLTELRGIAMYPDHLRVAVTAADVRRTVRMPHATVRRKIVELKTRGMVIDVAGGLIVPGHVLQKPVYATGLASHKAKQVKRMFAALHALSDYCGALEAHRIVHA